MSAYRDQIEAITRHPALEGLERSGSAAKARMDAFAMDLAEWLVGTPRETLGVLARVVTVVASRELRDPKKLCRDRPLLAVESAARAVKGLWPLLRSVDAPPPNEDPSPSSSESREGGAGAGGEDGEEEGEEEEAGSEAAGEEGEGEGEQEGDAEASADENAQGGEEGSTDDAVSMSEVMRDLAGGTTEQELPTLEKLAELLSKNMGQMNRAEAETSLGEALGPAAEEALDGALEVARGMRLVEGLLPGVGWSGRPGRLHEKTIAYLEALAVLMGQLEILREIADRLGRVEPSTKVKWWKDGGGEEVAGVRLSGQVTEALPSELALLGDPTTEDLFYQRWLERRLVSLELVGGGTGGSGGENERGPIIACVDTSGSMSGPPEAAAKALILALCRRVLPQGRTVHLMAFGGPGEITDVRLRYGRQGLEAVLKFLALRFEGGTDFDSPLNHALDLLEETELRKADILVVTDGRCIPGDQIVQRVHQVKAQCELKVASVVLGGPWQDGVKPFSDLVWVVQPREAAEKLGFLRRVRG